MRFVKGDAIAGLLILAISLTGGLVIGVVQRGMPLGDAARVYTLLTIGDGLVSQLPALLISTAAGLVVTRVASDEDGATLGPDLARQLLRPGALAATAMLLAVLALVPGPAAVAVPRRRRRRRRRWRGWRCAAARRRPRVPVADAPSPPPPLEVALDPALHAAAPSLETRLRRRHARARRRARPASCRRCCSPSTPGCRCAATRFRLRGIPLADGIVPDGRILVDVAPAQAARRRRRAAHRSSGDGRARRVGAGLVGGAPAGDRPRHARRPVGDRGAPRRRPARAPPPSSSASTRPSASSTPSRASIRRWCARWSRARADLTLVADVLRRLVAEGVGLRDLPTVLEALARATAEHARSRRASPSACARSSRASSPTASPSPPAATATSRRCCSTPTPKRPCAARSVPPATASSSRSSPISPTRSSPASTREARRAQVARHPDVTRAAPPRAPPRRGRAPAPARPRLPGALRRRRGRAGGHHPYYGVEYSLEGGSHVAAKRASAAQRGHLHARSDRRRAGRVHAQGLRHHGVRPRRHRADLAGRRALANAVMRLHLRRRRRRLLRPAPRRARHGLDLRVAGAPPQRRRCRRAVLRLRHHERPDAVGHLPALHAGLDRHAPSSSPPAPSAR